MGTKRISQHPPPMAYFHGELGKPFCPPFSPQAPPRPSAPEDPRRVCLDLPQDLPEVRRRGQGIVDMPFVVPVPVMQRPGAVCLVIPDPGYVGFGPDGLVLPVWPLLEQGDGHCLGDVGDADLVLGVRGHQIHDVPVEMGLGGGSDGVWNRHGVSVGS